MNPDDNSDEKSDADSALEEGMTLIVVVLVDVDREVVWVWRSRLIFVCNATSFLCELFEVLLEGTVELKAEDLKEQLAQVQKVSQSLQSGPDQCGYVQ